MRFLIYQLAFSLTMLLSGSDAKSVDFSEKTQETRGNPSGWNPRISKQREILYDLMPSEYEMEMKMDTSSQKSRQLRFERKRRFRRGSPNRWLRLPITWNLRSGWYDVPSNLRHGIRDTLALAFKVWADVSAVRFQYKARPPVDIEISFVPAKPWYIAWAYPPKSGFHSGDIYFNRNSGWTLSRGQSYDRYIYTVAAHEIGHSIGLSHSRDQQSIMVWYYKHVPVPVLSNSDISAVQSLYGKCYPAKITSFSESTYGTHILIDSNYWHYTDFYGNRNRGYPVRALNGFPLKVTYPVDEILFVPSKPSSFFIFKGFNFWEYDRQTNKIVASGQISSAWDKVTTVDAATHWQNSTFLFFKGVTVWVFDFTAKKVVQTNTTMSMFPALQRVRKIDTAFHWTGTGGDNNVYLFSGNKYWRANPLNSVVLGPFTIGASNKFENICVP
ncbi:matrix metalloproteinase-21-like [Acropora millepora]|uniref:matrix metalloproteinase-21-like n=1 Tax=Acropora millepora TaxID=45264 RepID=UPI001CF4C1EF|nr:matrix metalloproteinase-21-like [Acropora millepora]